MWLKRSPKFDFIVGETKALTWLRGLFKMTQPVPDRPIARKGLPNSHSYTLPTKPCWSLSYEVLWKSLKASSIPVFLTSCIRTVNCIPTMLLKHTFVWREENVCFLISSSGSYLSFVRADPSRVDLCFRFLPGAGPTSPFHLWVIDDINRKQRNQKNIFR